MKEKMSCCKGLGHLWGWGSEIESNSLSLCDQKHGPIIHHQVLIWLSNQKKIEIFNVTHKISTKAKRSSEN